MRISPLVWIAVLVAALVAFGLCMNFLFLYEYEPPRVDVVFNETGSWRDPGGAGADLRVDPSPDGSRLLLVGYGAPDELRVADRSLKTLAVLTPPGTPFAVSGAAWSEKGQYIIAWGRVAGASIDAIAVYGASTYAPADSVVPRESVPLTTVTCARFVARDRILAVSGDAPNGTSMVVFLEIGPFAFLKSSPVAGGAHVLAIESDGIDLVLLDDAGYLTVFSTRDWTLARRYHDLSGAPTAWCVRPSYPWLAGDSTGRVTAWEGHPQWARMNMTMASRPVQALCWGSDKNGSLVAVPASGGGSLLQAWALDLGGAMRSELVAEARTDETVVMMAPDPAAGGGVLAAFDDGTLRAYRLDVSVHRPPPAPSGEWKDPFSWTVIILIMAGIAYEAWRWYGETR